jgi:hypothetical protein
MHKIGLTEAEEDGQVFYHIWSGFDILAFFPFPKLVRKYIYYDDQIPQDIKQKDMEYYNEIIKKHIYAHQGRRYISKNPSHSARVRTLHQQFPDAKFINIVRNPLQVIPSTISLYSKHTHNYGDPDTEYSLQETVIEHSKHWYLYPHQYLKKLPADQYIRIHYSDFVSDPKATIKKIYQQFSFELTPDFEKILDRESEKAKSFKSKHKYNLRKMGLSRERIIREFKPIIQQADLEILD